MRILTYVLHGAWDTRSADGVIVLGVSADIEPLRKRLDEIAGSRAREYVEMCGYIQEERGERYYEVMNASGKYAKFYITEHEIYLPVPLMETVRRETERIHRIIDIGECLRSLYEEGSMPAWMYEYMHGNGEVTEKILQLFDKMEDCNTPFNTTISITVGDVMKAIRLDDEKLEYLWEKFGDVLIDEDGCILDGFLDFERGTHREEVWHWFDERHSGGVAGLMFGGE